MKKYPKVGLGVLIFNNQNNLLFGKRKNTHGAGTWALPGGHLEYGESPEECAIREVLEETNLVITSPKFVAITNDIFIEDEKHYITIIMQAIHPENGLLINKEPHKTEDWHWFASNNLPNNLFSPVMKLLKGECYNNSDTFIQELFLDHDNANKF